MSGSFLPYGRQVIEEDDIAAVVAALKGDFLTTGPTVDAFERALAEAVDVPEAVVCGNGTQALHLAALALDLAAGDAVIVPAITFLATANAARYCGAEVLFADVDPVTGLMLPEHAEAALARAGSLRPKAVFPVHLAGQAADPAALSHWAAGQGLAVVEDACHALGTMDGEGNRIGACRHSAMACFSFHPVKTVAMGEGGAVTTRDATVAARLRRLRCHGMERDVAALLRPELARAADGSANPWYYEMAELGFNYRATDIQCALGLSQLAKLPRFVARRRHLVALYDQALAPLAPLVRPLGRSGGQPGWHLYVARIDFDAAGLDRATVMHRLRARGVGTQVHYMPVAWQPYYRGRYGDVALPGAEEYYRTCLSLPLYPGMADDDVARVADALAQALRP